MIVSDELQTLFSGFRATLEDHEEQLRCFSRYGVQVEGWFKGELLYFLEKEKKMGVIRDFDREVRIPNGRRKIDFRVTFGKNKNFQDVWLEIKYWLIGPQKGLDYDAAGYFRDPTSVGIIIDAKKLGITKGDRAIVVLAVENPGVNNWATGVKQFNSKFISKNVRLDSITNPNDYPKSYFLGILCLASTCNKHDES